MIEIKFPPTPDVTFSAVKKDSPEIYEYLIGIVDELVELAMVYGNPNGDKEILKRNVVRGIDSGIFAFGANWAGSLIFLTWNYAKGAYLEFTPNNFSQQEIIWTMGTAHYMMNTN